MKIKNLLSNDICEFHFKIYIILERRTTIMTKRPAPGAGMRPVSSRPLTKPGEKTYMEAIMKPVNYKNHQVTCAYKK